MKKRIKGFTLIELLAVIVILAIIFLIVMPVVIGVINDARKGAFEASAYGFIKTAENQYMKKLITDDVDSKTYVFEDNQQTEGDLEFSGNAPRNGYVHVTNDGYVAIVIEDGVWLITKRLDENEITIEPFADQDLLAILNDIIGIDPPYVGSGIWGIDPEYNDGYPYLTWQREEYPRREKDVSGSTVLGGVSFETMIIEEETYHIVETAEQLDAVRADLHGRYIQMADINLASWGDWVPIGSSDVNSFYGVYDGNYYAVSNMRIWEQSGSYIGLFGYVRGKLFHIRLLNVDINHDPGGNYSNNGRVGALVGSLRGSGAEVHRCSATGTVINLGRGTGGLIGSTPTHAGRAVITESYSQCNVSGGTHSAAGLVGEMVNNRIENSYAWGNVVGDRGVGGFGNKGTSTTNDMQIISSYSIGSVSMSGTTGELGGFLGSSTAGRIASVTDSFYNSETTGLSDTGQGEPRTTAQMKNINTYLNWDFGE